MLTPIDSMGVTPIVDWLTWTVQYNENKSVGLPSHEVFLPDETVAVGTIRPYNNAMRYGLATAYWNAEHPEWRLCYVMTGSDLTGFREQGGNEVALIAAIIRLGGKITRLDAAFDIIGELCGDVMDLVMAFNLGWLKTNVQKISHVLEEDKDGQRAGATVYLGSRHSQRMLRVYDKGAQLDTPFAWVRAELECKQDYARKVANALVVFGLETVQAEIMGFVETGIPWFDDALTMTDFIPQVVVGRKQTDFEAWVMTVALPNVIKAIRMGTSGIREKLKLELDRIDFPDVD